MDHDLTAVERLFQALMVHGISHAAIESEAGREGQPACAACHRPDGPPEVKVQDLHHAIAHEAAGANNGYSRAKVSHGPVPATA
ncbi:hypothetical protein Rumeso_02383 [Rubellimicrobium mesophilum DSM 19309]|uniref:Uncharacterized protein n=1 Tax=Rubellimicrobium mesophilum DSM 19309 TaxID=442562 RepID=A0A017HQB0_9RHOB|nr:hypothetical protein Rumeso_02383 [Rubellimicrobium mesophilum DSM 19309]